MGLERGWGPEISLIEVRAMAVQQHLAESTAIFNVCIVEHCPAPFTVKIHKTCTSAVEQIPITVPASKIKGQCGEKQE